MHDKAPVGLSVWQPGALLCFWAALLSCTRACHRSVWPVLMPPQWVCEGGLPSCACSGCRAGTPGWSPGRQLRTWDAWMVLVVTWQKHHQWGCHPRIRWRLKDPCWFQLTYPSFSSVCLHIHYLTRPWERSSQEAPFGLWGPVSHTKEPCLKINSVDFGLCCSFPVF